jgi:hypothetical protein
MQAQMLPTWLLLHVKQRTIKLSAVVIPLWLASYAAAVCFDSAMGHGMALVWFRLCS